MHFLGSEGLRHAELTKVMAVGGRPMIGRIKLGISGRLDDLCHQSLCLILANFDAVQPQAEDGFGKRTGLHLFLYEVLEMLEQLGCIFTNVALMILEMVVVHIRHPGQSTTALGAKGRLAQRAMQEVTMFAAGICDQRFQQLRFVGIGSIGEQLIPQRQGAGNSGGGQKVFAQRIEGRHPVLTGSFFTHLFLELLIAPIEFLVLLDRLVMLDVPLEHSAVPQPVSDLFDIFEAPHIGLHHKISTRAVFALRRRPHADHRGLGVRVARQLRRQGFCLFYGDRLVKELDIGNVEGVQHTWMRNHGLTNRSGVKFHPAPRQLDGQQVIALVRRHARNHTEQLCQFAFTLHHEALFTVARMMMIVLHAPALCHEEGTFIGRDL